MILVTGASGNIGKQVIKRLSLQKIPYQQAVRPGEADRENGIVFDFLKPETFGPAVQGCESVFLLRPPNISNVKSTLNLFLDEARRRNVRQVVFISVAGAGTNPLVPHHAVEQKLKAGPPSWTIIRPGFFMQNLEDAYLGDIKEDHRIYLPSGYSRVAFVDAGDIGELAVKALVDPTAHSGQTYTVTGPQALRFEEVATLLSVELGHKIVYKRASILGYMNHLHQRGLPFAQILVQTILHVGLRFGQAQEVSDTLQKVLGHVPRTITDYIHENRMKWM